MTPTSRARRTGSGASRFRSSLCFLAALLVQASPLHARPTSTNYVLELDGTNSYVELPPNAFSKLTDATIEGWVKWDRFAQNTRFFDFGEQQCKIALGQSGNRGFALLVNNCGTDTANNLGVENLLRTNQWCHIAAVVGRSGMRFYFNGQLVLTNSYTGTFTNLPGTSNSYLGWSRTFPSVAPFNGLMDEVRVWRIGRTQAQVIDNMFKRLAGNEPDLFALWNFDQADARDSTTNALHGKLIGQAKAVPGELQFPTIIHGIVTDEDGKPIPTARVTLEESGKSIGVATTGSEGAYFLATYSNVDAGTLEAGRGKLGARRTDLKLVRGQPAEVNLVLSQTTLISGRLLTFDGTTHTAVAVQAVTPAGQVEAATYSDEGGNYELFNVKPGAYQLRCHGLGRFFYHAPDDAHTNAAGATIFQIDAGETLAGINFKFVPFKIGVWRTYSPHDGLANGIVFSIDSDPDGVLWMGTSGGLSRFDGHQFKLFTAKDGLLESWVYRVRVAPDRTVWTRTVSGKLARFDGARFQAIPLPPGESSEGGATLTSTLLGAFGETSAFDSKGTLWVPFEGNLYTNAGKEFLKVSLSGLPEGLSFTSLGRGQKGQMWIGTTSGLFHYDGTQVHGYSTQDGLVHDLIIKVEEAPDGTAWIGTAQGLSHFDGRRFVNFTTRDGLPSDLISAIHCQTNGTVWFGTHSAQSLDVRGRGLCRFDGQTFVNFTTADGLTHNEIKDIHAAADGSLWCATDGGGVSRFDPRSFENFSTRDGLSNNYVAALRRDRDGSVWVGTGWYHQPGALARLEPHRVVNVGEQLGLPREWVWRLFGDPSSALWIQFYWGGVYRKIGDEMKRVEFVDGLGRLSQVLESDPTGTLCFEFDSGLYRLDGTNFQKLLGREVLPGGGLGAVNVPPGGRIFVSAGNRAENSGDFIRIEGGKAVPIVNEMGGNVSSIRSMTSSTNGVLWCASWMDGVVRYDGHTVKTFGPQQGVAHHQISQVHTSPDGTLWCATFGGVSRYDGIAWSNLDTGDGLAGNTVFAIEEGGDGSMWFGTLGGISHFRPTKSKPMARIRSILADKDHTDLTTLPQFLTGSRITVKFDAIDFKTIRAKHQFRCRVSQAQREMESGSVDQRSFGFNDWSSPSKETQFEWTPKEPGTYTFAVQTIDRDLNYSTPALAVLTVRHPWFLNAWITVPVGGTFAGLFVWVFIARALYVRKRREAERLRERVFEQEHRALEAAEQSKIEIEAKNSELNQAKEVAEEARQQAESANKAKSLFLANMSHEIRTPMNAILGYSQILKRDKELPPKHRQSVETIEKSGDHLLGMINDILDLSKIEAGRMELQASDFDLNELIAGIAAMFRMRCEEKELKLNVVRPADGPIPIRGDEGKLRQVLINLLGNAVKFSDQGEVTLKIRPAQTPNQKSEIRNQKSDQRLVTSAPTVYRFDIIDTGPGISEADQKAIFEPFQQSDAGLKKGGTGLGLAITRRQVELMGGEVKLESTLGKGSRFYFEIPLPPAQGQLVPPQAGESREVVRLAAGSQVNALVVDDNQNNRDVLSQLLQGIGCRVRVAENALAAFDGVKEELPDIIFMDIRMPGMNGAEATRRIIAEHGPDKIKIVAITASVLEHEKAGHMAAGFHSFLAKPFRFPDVCASLKQFLKVDFDYADEPAGEPGAADEMDASKCSIPLPVWSSLKEAADRYSLTGLKKAMEPLENNGDSARKAVEYLKRLIHEGDLDGVSAFLEQVKQEGNVI